MSHNLRDQSLAIQLNDRICQEGLTTFLAQDQLHRNPAQGVHAACYEALSVSQVMLVCIGPSGIGPSQEIEITTGFQLEAEGSLEIIVVLLGNATRDKIPPNYSSLRAKLPYVFPDQVSTPGIKRIIQYLKTRSDEEEDHAPPEPGDTRYDQEAEKVAEELVDTIVLNGLTVFVGSLWPERDRKAVFNPNEVAHKLLKEIDIPVPDPDRVMALDRAALCYTIARGRDRAGGEKAEREILSNVNNTFSLVNPEAYGALSTLAKRFSERDQDEPLDEYGGTPPFVIVTTNVDRLLERCFVKQQVPFLRLVARSNGDFEQMLFQNIVGINDERTRIETRLEDEDEIANGPKITETTPYDRDALERPGRLGERFRLRQAVLTDQTPQQIWQDLQVDYAIYEHARKVRRIYKGDSEKAHKMERLRAKCAELGIPILFKVFGCVDSDAEWAFSISRMFQFSRNPLWIPQDMRTTFGRTASLFLGYSPVDACFVHLYEQVLTELFENNVNRRRVLICPSRIGPKDGPREVDTVLMQTLHNRSDNRFLGIIALDDKPISFVNRLLQHELLDPRDFI